MTAGLIAAPPQPGQIVRVRQRLYTVEETTPPPQPGDATLVRLSCVDDDAQGQPLAVLWERELDPEVLRGEAWDRIERGFDEPHLFGAYLHTLRWNCVHRPAAAAGAVPRGFPHRGVPARPVCEFLLDYEEDEDEAGATRCRRKPWRYGWPDEIRDAPARAVPAPRDKWPSRGRCRSSSRMSPSIASRVAHHRGEMRRVTCAGKLRADARKSSTAPIVTVLRTFLLGSARRDGSPRFSQVAVAANARSTRRCRSIRPDADRPALDQPAIVRDAAVRPGRLRRPVPPRDDTISPLLPTAGPCPVPFRT